MNEIIKLESLKTDYWRSHAKREKKQPEVDYDDDLDVLYMYFAPIEPKDRIITHYLDGHVAVLFRHADKQIVGMAIESFRKSFLARYANSSWVLSKTHCQLAGIRDFVFKVDAIKVETPKPHYTIPMPIEPRVRAEPVFC